MLSPTYTRIYETIKRIPKGKLATYGQIAELAGMKGQARLVGYALYALTGETDTKVPWFRVVNAKGEISQLPDPDGRIMQRDLLEKEGIQFNKAGRIDLIKYRWQP